jgi:hypothetical protein
MAVHGFERTIVRCTNLLIGMLFPELPAVRIFASCTALF